MAAKPRMDWKLKILETHQEMEAAEELQRAVWTGSETEVVPVHLLVTAAHNGGLVIGAYRASDENTSAASRTDSASPPLIGFVFGFPGLYFTPDGPRPKHCSHMLGVQPEYRDAGVGFALKRAQWQMVRHQGLDLITWTYDPLLSRNAHLNITRLGAVCSTYLRDIYGIMRDGMNAGLPSDRFQVDWWVNSKRVTHRLSKRARPPLELNHYLAAEVNIINRCSLGADGWVRPPEKTTVLPEPEDFEANQLLMVEIPANFLALKNAEPALAVEWRMSTRELFEGLFARGYLVTDLVYVPENPPRSYYVLSHGESTL